MDGPETVTAKVSTSSSTSAQACDYQREVARTSVSASGRDRKCSTWRSLRSTACSTNRGQTRTSLITQTSRPCITPSRVLSVWGSSRLSGFPATKSLRPTPTGRAFLTFASRQAMFGLASGASGVLSDARTTPETFRSMLVLQETVCVFVTHLKICLWFLGVFSISQTNEQLDAGVFSQS